MVKHQSDYVFFFNWSGLLLELVWGECTDVCVTRVLSCKWVLVKALCILRGGDAVRLSLYSKRISQVHQREHWFLRKMQPLRPCFQCYFFVLCDSEGYLWPLSPPGTTEWRTICILIIEGKLSSTSVWLLPWLADHVGVLLLSENLSHSHWWLRNPLGVTEILLYTSSPPLIKYTWFIDLYQWF